jgi:hypothetical protein
MTGSDAIRQKYVLLTCARRRPRAEPHFEAADTSRSWRSSCRGSAMSASVSIAVGHGAGERASEDMTGRAGSYLCRLEQHRLQAGTGRELGCAAGAHLLRWVLRAHDPSSGDRVWTMLLLLLLVLMIRFPLRLPILTVALILSILMSSYLRPALTLPLPLLLVLQRRKLLLLLLLLLLPSRLLLRRVPLLLLRILLWGVLLLLLLVLPLRASAEGFEQELDDLHEWVLRHGEGGGAVSRRMGGGRQRGFVLGDSPSGGERAQSQK